MPVAATPEPSSLFLMLAGAGLVFAMRKRWASGLQHATQALSDTASITPNAVEDLLEADGEGIPGASATAACMTDLVAASGAKRLKKSDSRERRRRFRRLDDISRRAEMFLKQSAFPGPFIQCEL